VYCPHSPALFQWGKVPKDGKSGYKEWRLVRFAHFLVYE
jgi:hypothetical protein